MSFYFEKNNMRGRKKQGVSSLLFNDKLYFMKYRRWIARSCNLRRSLVSWQADQKKNGGDDKMKTALVTDGKYRSSIAAVRALHRAGYRVVVTQTRADIKSAPAVSVSKSCDDFRWIDGACADADYAEKLLSILKEYEHPVLFCVGAVTLNTVAARREEFAALANFLIAPKETLDALNDKESVHQRALELGIPVPREYDGTPESYPVVVKPHCGEKFGLKAADRYAVANNEAEFDAIMEKMQRYDPSPIVQQKITGAGAGVSLLLGRESELLGALCHRRVREYPITGGPSTCCESFYDEKMIDEAYELLKSFHFTGLAMVEFKGDCILEVNPRVWGSFPMTEAAQSPIVAHYAQAAQGGQVTYTAKDYRTGVKMRFFLNDTVAALSYLKAGRVKEGLRGLGDFFTAKEALSAKGDGKVMRAYLKKSLFER